MSSPRSSFCLALAFVLVLASPAAATLSDWDPHDRPGVLDLRWGGLTVLDGDTVRLGISLWERVYPRHLRSDDRWIRVSFPACDLSGVISPTQHGWSLWLSYQGVYWQGKLKVDHPRGTLFRVWVDAWMLSDDVCLPGTMSWVGISTQDVVGGRRYRDVLDPLSL